MGSIRVLGICGFDKGTGHMWVRQGYWVYVGSIRVLGICGFYKDTKRFLIAV